MHTFNIYPNYHISVCNDININFDILIFWWFHAIYSFFLLPLLFVAGVWVLYICNKFGEIRTIELRGEEAQRIRGWGGGGVKGGPPSPPYYSMRKNYGKRENTIKSSEWQDWWKDICWNYVNLALSNKPGNPASKWIQQHYTDRWISQ